MAKEKKYFGLAIFGLITWIMSGGLIISIFLDHTSDGIISWDEVRVIATFILILVTGFITGKIHEEIKE